jgi:organic radical activating enzyme
MIKTRIEEKSNYRSVWVNGKTLRFQIDPKKPIKELEYPEFYDIKVTDKCSLGRCKYCYMNSNEEGNHYDSIVQKVQKFFGKMDKNQLPYQIAYGGGCPLESPEFIELLKVTKEEFDIVPNYTTNGTWVVKDPSYIKELLDATEKYCGGVAVSCHPHLEKYWRKATALLHEKKVKLNFHIIISDKESIDKFIEIFKEYKDIIDYFVLLPYGVQGRAKPKEIDWDYLVSVFPKDNKKIAFGANFYPYLLRKDLDVKVSLYQPEIMSKFITLEGNGKMYKSSFSNEVIKENLF